MAAYVILGDVLVLSSLGDPVGIERDGRLAEVRNCAPPKKGFETRCRALACELRLASSGALPRGAHAVGYKSRDADPPSRGAQVQVQFVLGSATIGYGRCEFADGSPQSSELVSRDQFDQDIPR